MKLLVILICFYLAISNSMQDSKPNKPCCGFKPSYTGSRVPGVYPLSACNSKGKCSRFALCCDCDGPCLCNRLECNFLNNHFKLNLIQFLAG